MNPLTVLLSERIARHGPLTFEEFMRAALYDPQHGYYASGRATIGRHGDFITNISVGPLFGRLLARQFAEMWRRLGAPAEFSVVEQGAHRGDFAGDVVEGAREFEPAFSAALRYTIVEPHPASAAAQRARLAPFAGVVTWAETVSALPLVEGVFFSNELLDAFPVHVLQKAGREWQERRVGWDGERFVWTETPPVEPRLRALAATLPTDRPEGYTTEANLHAASWMVEVARKLRRGWVLAIDYGYPRPEYLRPERTGGTLSAYSRHRRVDDPLAAPGEVDLTAHVDFTTLAEAALVAGLQVAGFTDQHHFMAGLSRLHFTDTEYRSPAQEKEMRAFKTLMHPNLLGSSFKAICFERGGGGAPLSGFTYDRRGQLF